MATNREKYIDSMTDKELAELLASKCFITVTGILTYNIFGKGKESDINRIVWWLSQEVREDTVNIPSTGKMPKTDKTTFDYEKPEIVQLTKKEYEENKLKSRSFERQLQRMTDKYKILEKQHKDLKNNELRLDEELDKIKDFNFRITKILESHNLNYTKELTADEMFNELGYEKPCINDNVISYKKHGLTIRITIDGEYTKYCGNKTVYEIAYITEAEDKAIHKKIAELRLLKGNHIVGDIVDGKVLCDDGIWRDYR